MAINKAGMVLATTAAAAFLALGTGCASQQSGASAPTPQVSGGASNYSCNGHSCKGMKASCKGKVKKEKK